MTYKYSWLPSTNPKKKSIQNLVYLFQQYSFQNICFISDCVSTILTHVGIKIVIFHMFKSITLLTSSNMFLNNTIQKSNASTLYRFRKIRNIKRYIYDIFFISQTIAMFLMHNLFPRSYKRFHINTFNCIQILSQNGFITLRPLFGIKIVSIYLRLNMEKFNCLQFIM